MGVKIDDEFTGARKAQTNGDVDQKQKIQDARLEALNKVEIFLGRFVAYPSEAARIAHALWIAHTHTSWKPGSPHRASHSCHPNPDPAKPGH
jgi:hypothetical protein